MTAVELAYGVPPYKNMSATQVCELVLNIMNPTISYGLFGAFMMQCMHNPFFNFILSILIRVLKFVEKFPSKNAHSCSFKVSVQIFQPYSF